MSAAGEIIARWSVELDSITQALDEALRLLEDPQALYDAVPEGLKPLLVRAVFEKIWIMDDAVVGTEVTEPVATLLTFEAQLALAEQQAGAPTQQADADTDTDTTYHRSRLPLALLTDVADTWDGWLAVERPYGALLVDKQNPGVHGGRGSNMHHLVAGPGLEPGTSWL